MSEIVEPLRPVRTLLLPKKYLPLRNFSCGRKGGPWEKLVNDCVRDLYLGRETLTQTLVVLEDADGKLIGVCSFYPHALGRFMSDAQRIHVIGTDRKYHGERLADDSRPADALLRGALEQIERACNDRMPHVSTLVSPENHRSRALFARHGFRELPYVGEGAIRCLRAPHARRSPVALRPAVAVGRMVQKARKGSRGGEAIDAAGSGD